MDDLRLYKFGERKHLCDLIHEGVLCLTPATKYGEKGLSKGAFDPEELISAQTLPDGVSFDAYCGKTGKSKGKVEFESVGLYEAQSETNYYVFCMTYDYSIDLYKEFKADTCVVITDPDRFINQACKSIMQALPGWFVNAGTVKYRSKKAFYSLYPSYHDIFYGKGQEDYIHQHEIRIVCAPPTPRMNLEKIFVEIGNLHGYTFITGVEAPNSMVESEYSNALGSPFKCDES
jgi:hypothetical protein